MENQGSVVGRLSFLASVVGDGAVAGIQNMAKGTGAAMTKLASSVPAKAFAVSASALAAVSAALVGGTIAAAQFEESFALVRKVLARASEEELGDIRDAILDLSTQIPVTADELARLGSIAGQLGVGVQQIPQFIDTVAKLGVATNMTAEQAAFSIARLANVTGIGAENADKLANVLVRLGNNTAATESEITLLATRFGAVGKIAGLTADETLAFSASVRATGTEAQAGATALQKFFLALQQAAAQGGSKLTAFADTVGMTAQEFKALAEEDISEAATVFVEGLARVGDAGGDVSSILQAVGLGSVRVSKVMLSLSSDTEELRSNLELASDEMERQQALNAEAEKRFGTLINQIKRFRQAIKAIMIDIGEGIVPVLATFIGNLADALSGIREFSDVLETDKFVNFAKVLGIISLALVSLKIPAVTIAFNTLAAALTTFTSASFIAANAAKMLFVAFKPFLIGAVIAGGVTMIVKHFSNMAGEIAGAKRNLEDFRDVMDQIPIGDIDFEIDEAVAKSLFENLEEDTQEAFKKAFGNNTQSVIEDILENTSRNIGDVVSDTFADMQKNTLVLFSAGAGTTTAMDALDARTKAMKENLVLVERQFGAESEITRTMAEAIRLQEKRLTQGGLLSEKEEIYYQKLLARLQITKEMLALQQDTVDSRMEELESLVVAQLVEDDRFFRKAEILKTDEDILAVARQLAPRNAEIAKLIGYMADDSEDLAENFGAFGEVLNMANSFASELNDQLSIVEALEDIEEAKDSLSSARKQISDLNKEELEVTEELASVRNEINELMKDGVFLNDDLISIREEELELAELIKMANGEITLTYQEQLRLLKLKKEREILVRAAQQGTLTNAEVQIGAIDEQIKAIETRGVTEEDVLEQTQKVQEAKDEAKINAQERVIELQDKELELSQRIIDISDEIESAKSEVKKAQRDILIATNESVIAFAKLGDKGVEEMKRLGDALGYPKEQLDAIASQIAYARLHLGTLPAFGNNAGMLTGDDYNLQSSDFNPVARQMGGMVRLGQKGLVGEAGMEIIKPMPHGVMVTPMQGNGGGQPINQYVSLNVTGLPTDPLAARKIAQNIQRELNKLKNDGRSGIVR